MTVEEYIWNFNRTLHDDSLIFNGTSSLETAYMNKSVTGDEQSLYFDGSANFISVHQPFLSLYNRSWTFEIWVYVKSLKNPGLYGIIGQCPKKDTRMCLHMNIHDLKIHFGLYNDDLRGQISLNESRWYHVGFVFDCSALTKSIYLDGVFDSSNNASGCFQATNGSIIIGKALNEDNGNFRGLIDQVSFHDRVKHPEELLRDATLTFYLSFDSASLKDQGPLKLSTKFVPTSLE